MPDMQESVYILDQNNHTHSRQCIPMVTFQFRVTSHQTTSMLLEKTQRILSFLH
jgi:hypothetical protein